MSPNFEDYWKTKVRSNPNLNNESYIIKMPVSEFKRQMSLAFKEGKFNSDMFYGFENMFNNAQADDSKPCDTKSRGSKYKNEDDYSFIDMVKRWIGR